VRAGARAGTGDWGRLFNRSYWVDRESAVAALLLTRALPFYDARIVELAADFERAAHAALGAASPV